VWQKSIGFITAMLNGLMESLVSPEHVEVFTSGA